MLTLRKHELLGHDVYEIMQGELTDLHWLDSSIFMTEECLLITEFPNFIKKYVSFNYYGPTEINKSDWEAIKHDANLSGSKTTKELIAEIDCWAIECFKNHPCFTICGP